jgi:hypothetical protein
MIQSKQMMVTIAWNLLEFHIVDVFPKGKVFNTMYYIKHILKSILILRPKFRQHRLFIHANNVGPNTPAGFKYFVIQFFLESFDILHTL